MFMEVQSSKTSPISKLATKRKEKVKRIRGGERERETRKRKKKVERERQRETRLEKVVGFFDILKTKMLKKNRREGDREKWEGRKGEKCIDERKGRG